MKKTNDSIPKLLSVGMKIYNTIILSIFWVVFSIPIITMPASSSAAVDIGAEMYQDDDIKIMASFWNLFQQRVKKSLVPGILFPFLFFLCTLNIYGSLTMIPNNMLSIFLCSTGLIIGVLFLSISVALPLAIAKGSDQKQIWLIAFSIMLNKWKTCLLMVLCLIVVVVICLNRYTALLFLPGLFSWLIGKTLK